MSDEPHVEFFVTFSYDLMTQKWMAFPTATYFATPGEKTYRVRVPVPKELLPPRIDTEAEVVDEPA